MIPIVKVDIFTPPEYIGSLMELIQERRGEQLDLQYLDANRCQMVYKIPLNEIVFDFFDQLKSRSRGYASMDYEIMGYEPSDLVKLDILLNGEVNPIILKEIDNENIIQLILPMKTY